ncbi:MAG: hypothetical protein AABX89_03920 [Candidatus Thermoplasmatota archaeon]
MKRTTAPITHDQGQAILNQLGHLPRIERVEVLARRLVQELEQMERRRVK